MMQLKLLYGYFREVEKVKFPARVTDVVKLIAFSKRKIFTSNSLKKLTFVALTSPICTEL